MWTSIEAIEKQIAAGRVDNCYLLVGSSVCLLEEARACIYKMLIQKRIYDHQIYVVSNQMDWQALKKKNSEADLFHPAFIELRCEEVLKTDKGMQLHRFVQWCKAIQPFATVVISYAQTSSKLQPIHWFQKIVGLSTVVLIEKPTAASLPGWIGARLNAVGFQLTKEAIATVIQYTESNLLAILQLIKKIKLIYSDNRGRIESTQLNFLLEDQATFELFHLTDAVLAGNSLRCRRILKYLESVRATEALVLGYLMRIVRTSSQLRYGLDQGEALPVLFQRCAVWSRQQAGFKRISEQLDREHILRLFEFAYEADLCIKGAQPGSKWHHLQKISFALAGDAVMW